MVKIKKGDNVRVMRGKDSGKDSEVLKVIKMKNTYKVLVKGINIVKKSQKPNPQLGIAGGISEMEKPIDISNVMLVDKKTGKPTRVGINVDKVTGKRSRIAIKSGEII